MPRREASYSSENMNYCTIPLTKGKVAKVDVSDYEWLSQWKWFAFWNKNTRSFYAKRNATAEEMRSGSSANVLMHRQILGLPCDRTRRIQGDHRDGDTLNNQRENLRIATASQQGMNRGIRSDNKSGYKGVTFFPQTGQWRARTVIKVDGKRKSFSLGLHDTPELAFAAYCAGVKKLHGEFARFR